MMFKEKQIEGYFRSKKYSEKNEMGKEWNRKQLIECLVGYS